MNQRSSSNNIKNDDFTINTKKSDYKKLIIKLKEISKIIALLEKNILKNF